MGYQYPFAQYLRSQHSNTMTTKDPLIPSASVILLQEHEGELRTLLLKKNQGISFGGSWVFPGGRIDDDDAAHNDNSQFATAKRAACRECLEETGLSINATGLIPVSRWTTPAIRPKRFKTVFFLYAANNANQSAIENVVVDGGEIVEAQWLPLITAIEQHDRKQIKLAGPAFVTLSQIITMANEGLTLGSIISRFNTAEFSDYSPRIQLASSGPICLYQGDSAYGLINQHEVSKDNAVLEQIEQAKSQHRLYMHGHRPWQYVKTAIS